MSAVRLRAPYRGATVRAAAAIVCILIVAPPGMAADVLPLVQYADPDKTFTMSYPSGWHVKRFPDTHATTFYLDDPDEGAAFSILPPPFVIKGEATAAQVFGTLVYAPAQKRYPDFEVVGHQQRQLGNLPNGTVLEATEAWTNSHHLKMHGYTKVFAVKNIGKGSTTVSLVGYQAAAKDYDRYEATFNEMIRTTRYTAAENKK